MSNDDFDDDIDFGGDTYLPDCDPKPATRGDIYWVTQELEGINGTLGMIRDEMVELKRRAPVPSYHAPIFMAGIFLVGASVGWLLTPAHRITQVYRYDYRVSAASAPRLAVDPGATGIPGLSKRPAFIGPAALTIPRLQPKQQPKKGGRHE